MGFMINHRFVWLKTRLLITIHTCQVTFYNVCTNLGRETAGGGGGVALGVCCTFPHVLGLQLSISASVNTSGICAAVHYNA